MASAKVTGLCLCKKVRIVMFGTVKPIDGKVRFKTSGAANLDSFKAFLLYEENFAF